MSRGWRSNRKILDTVRNTIAASATALVAWMTKDVDFFAAFAVFGWIVPVFVHELGHAAGAQASGWRVWIFHVTPWVLRLKPLSLTLAGRVGGPDVGGFVFATPRTRAADTTARDLWFVAGGPLASWALGLGFIVWAAWFWRDANFQLPDQANAARALVAGTGVLSVAFAIGSSWPSISKHGSYNDAALFLLALHEQSEARRGHGASFAAALRQHNVPKHLWDAWIREETEKEEFAFDAANDAYFDALSANDDAAARAAIAHLRNAAPFRDREVGNYEAYLDAMAGGVASAESKLIESVAMTSDAARLRELTLALIQSGAGEHTEARGRLDALETSVRAAHAIPPPLWLHLIAAARERLQHSVAGP